MSEITDFVQGQDQLAFSILVHENDAGPLIIQDTADGTGAEVYMGSTLVAQITGGQGLTLADLDIEFIIEQNAGALDYTDSDTSALIAGNHSDNVINGEGGNDTIVAGSNNGKGADIASEIYQGGNDVLNGGAGDDYIIADGGTYTAYNDGSSPIDAVRDLHIDTLNGGAGNDTLNVTNGGILTGGEGADLFVVNQNMHYVDNDLFTGEDLIPEPIQITDFAPGEDVINIGYFGDFSGFNGPSNKEVTIEAWEDGEGSDILLLGRVIASVTGTGALTYDDLRFDRFVSPP